MVDFGFVQLDFYVRSNFTLETLSTSDIEIEFHSNYFGNLICYGNASIDDQSVNCPFKRSFFFKSIDLVFSNGIFVDSKNQIQQNFA